MKKLLLSISFLAVLTSAKAQITLFEDNFDTYTDFAITNVASWTLTDVDQKSTYGFTGITFQNTGVKKSFQVFNSTQTTSTTTGELTPLDPTDTSDWTARSGDKAMVCFAASTAPPLNNDWLISPQITLGASGNILTFWAKSCDATYGLEKFKVGISTTGTATSNFTVISGTSPIVTADDITWAEYTYDLNAYSGMPVYISINCVSDDQFGFAVDDFKVTATMLKTNDFASNNFSISPNPAKDNFVITLKNNVKTQNVSIVDINGRVVKQFNTAFENQAQFNIADLNSGVYFVKVQTEQGVESTKLVKN